MKSKIPKRKRATVNNESPEEIVASIDDLLTEILLRLPVSSLSNFKLVSKHWHSLIANPDFIRRWRTPNPNPAVGLFLPGNPTNFLEYVNFPKDSNLTRIVKLPLVFRILQSCNGLLLCRSDTTKDYYVCNPTTGQCSRPLPKLDGARWMFLAFDPAKSLDPYRVVCVRCEYILTYFNRTRLHIEIYDPETNAWRSSGVDPFTTDVDFGKGVYWNNAIHWICSSGGDSWYFNVCRQVLNRMPNPPMHEFSSSGIRRFYLWESCDHLHYIRNYGPGTEFSVYEMKRDYSEWFVKYQINLSLGISANPWMIGDGPRGMRWYSDFCLLSIVRGDDDASFLVFRIKEKVIRYNIVLKTFEKMYESEDLAPTYAFRFEHINGWQYIESLCPV